MAKPRQSKTDHDPIAANVRKQYKNLFGGESVPPAPINIREMEALKARVAELEAKLTQGGAAPNQPTIPLASALPAVPPALAQTPVAETPHGRPSGQEDTPLVLDAARNAFRVTLIGLPASIVAASFYLYLAVQAGAWQLYLWSADIWLLALAVLGSMLLIRRERTSSGVWLLLMAIIVTFIGAVALIEGIGLLIGVSLAVLVSIIAGQTFRGNAGLRAILWGVLGGAVAVLLDLFGPAYRYPEPAPVRTFLPAILGLVIILYGVVIVRQFRAYSLATKIIMALVLVAALSTSVVAVTMNRAYEGTLVKSAETNLLSAASQLVTRLDDFITTNQAVLAIQAQEPDIVEYLDLHATGQPDDPLLAAGVRGLLDSYVQRDPEDITSYALLDRNGVEVMDTVAAHVGSNVSKKDFFLNPLQTGQPYVSSPILPSSENKDAQLYFSAPVKNPAGQVVGVVLLAYDMRKLQAMVAEVNGLAGPQSFAVLLDENHVRLAHGTDPSLVFKSMVPLDPALFAELQAAGRLPAGSPQDLSTNLPDMEKALLTIDKQPVFVSASAALGGKLASTAVVPLKSRPWLVYVRQQQDVFLAPIQVQSRTAVLLTMIILAVAGAVALLLARALINPILHLTSVARGVAAGDLNTEAKIESQDEIGTLAAAFNGMTGQLRGLIGSLEQRVSQRTHDLELASEVGRTVSEKSADIYALLEQAVELIRDRFDLYYTQIYLADPAARTLALRAGTGEAGRELMRRGHHLAIGAGSLNGRAAAERHAVIVADTAENPNFLPNPLLPNTRSEMAIPLIAGGKVAGVLDMQSDQPGALNEANLPAFEALAGQLAVALENAALFADAKEARSEVEAQVRRLTEQGWRDFMDAIERGQRVGFAYNQQDIVPLQAKALTEPLKGNALSVPVTVAGGQIGTIQLGHDADHIWTNRDREIARAAANQLAQHVENLRVLAQAERYRADAEDAARRLTREGWEAYLKARREPASGYKFDLNEVRPFKARSNGNAVGAFEYPLVVRNEVVGTLMVEDSPRPSDEVNALVYAVSSRLSAHLENLRLTEQTQQALIQTEEVSRQNELILDTAGEGIFGLDESGNHTFVNPAAAQMLGFPAEEIVGKHSHSVWHHSHADGSAYPESECPIYLSLRDGVAKSGDEYFLRKDGSGFPVAFTSTPIREGDRVAGAVVTFRDITEAKQAEEALRVAQERTQTILESVTLPMVITRMADNRFTFVNQPGLEIVGMKYEDVINQPAPNFYYDAEERNKFLAALRAEGQVSNMAVQLLRSDNQPFWAFLSARIFNYQGEPSILTTFMDITERIQAQETIAQRAAQLETVAAVSTTTATLLDPDRLLQTVVDVTKERFGMYHVHVYLADESWKTLLLAAGAGEVGRSMVAAQHAISMDTEKSLVARAAREHQAAIVNDVRSDPSFLMNPLLPDTRSEMAVPMIAGDKVIGVFDVQSDKVNGFTEADAHIYTTLASQVAIALQNARLYAEQSATVTQLRELDRLKSSFLANMSHELRTPLNSILGFADVILEELDGPLTENMNTDVQLIQKNGQHLLNLINDVLDMAKIEAGRMSLNPERFRLHEVLEEVVSITSPLASEKGLSLFIEPDSDQKVQIYADRTRIRQVMLNLVHNAVKFTEKGKVSICAGHQSENILICVRDTGLGIPPDKLEVVFQEFAQVDTSATRKAGGTGLGLPISRQLIDMHGGRMWAESTGVAGEGSAFYVELPLEAKISEPVEKLTR